MSVVELVDVTDEAKRLGLRCNVRVWPDLIAKVDATTAITRLRDVVLATASDPAMAGFVAMTVHGDPPHGVRRWPRDFDAIRGFFRRMRAGLGGVSVDGYLLAIPMATAAGLVTMLCSLHRDGVSLTLESELADPFAGAVIRARVDRLLFVTVYVTNRTVVPIRRVPVGDGLVIGRAPDCGLQIRDGRVSRKHVGVAQLRGVYFLSDLGSVNGVYYKGMRIDNKRIDDGDVFVIGDHELRFSFE
jgi:hypothetical protein